ncbi:hypothetical protein BD560DRAFT_430695 [Blakeslea trispora]|nr:hypothetical protein BD560DRAFT_430695 [Blakeslea trispora]
MSATPPPSSQTHLDDSKKRTRVTPSQLSVLEQTFSVSATPDSKMRKQLAFKLQMPERSIQIWFQNRRAKVKMLQRRVLIRQEQEVARARLCAEATGYSPSSSASSSYWYLQQQQQQQQQFARQMFPQSNISKPPIHRAWSSDMISANSFISPPPPPPNLSQMFNASQQYDTPSISITGPKDLDDDIYNMTISPSPTPQSFVMPRRLESEPLQPTPTLVSSLQQQTGMITATAVTVGSWHRMKISQQDLMCFYKMNERAFSWHIRDSNYHFKMMISFDSIASIELNVLDDHISAQIDLDLLEPPIFFMETNGQWVQCSDFTEGMQASIILRHTVRGLASDLRHELLTVAGMDERLCQITRFPSTTAPSASSVNMASIEQALLMDGSQNWRHQSLPLSTTPTKDYWIPSAYPL